MLWWRSEGKHMHAHHASNVSFLPAGYTTDVLTGTTGTAWPRCCCNSRTTRIRHCTMWPTRLSTIVAHSPPQCRTSWWSSNSRPQGRKGSCSGSIPPARCSTTKPYRLRARTRCWASVRVAIGPSSIPTQQGRGRLPRRSRRRHHRWTETVTCTRRETQSVLVWFRRSYALPGDHHGGHSSVITLTMTMTDVDPLGVKKSLIDDESVILLICKSVF
jgi:hypothetical protein